MSTVTDEKPKAAKAPSPLGSFIGKLTPKPVEKPVTEEKKGETDAANGERTATTVQTPEAQSGSGATVTTDADADVVQKDAAKSGKSSDVDAVEKPKDEKTEKRLKDTQAWGNEEHKARLAAEQRAADLAAQLKRIEQKLDGTYEEPTHPSTEQVATDADTKGRIRASHNAAVRQYGKAFVMETVWNPDSPYQELQQDPRIRARVMEAEDPVLEAIAVVKEHRDGQKYGRTPEEIRKKMEEELAPKLKQEILEGLKTKPGPATNTLGSVRGGTERTEQKNDAPTRLSLASVFPWGASRN